MASKRFSRLFRILAGAVADVEDIFLLEGRLERFAHFWALVVRQFLRHRCLVRASALSYSTLLALIPLLAIALGITSSWLKDTDQAKLDQFVEKMVASVTPAANVPTNFISSGPVSVQSGGNTINAATGNALPVADTNAMGSVMLSSNTPAATEPIVTMDTQKEVARWLHDLIQKTSGSALGAVGFILLVLTAISLLRGIEETFNDIWGVTRGRTWWMQFLLYSVIIIYGPMFLAAALGLTGSAYLQNTRAFLEASPFLAPLFKHALPIAILSLALGLFYRLTPNTKVTWRAAMAGGLFSGIAWHSYNQLGVLLAAKAISASKFYGGLFLIVLLMFGLYVLWVILLFGAQIAYAWQNRALYLQDRLAENVNQRGREFVALRIMMCLGQRFQRGERPPTVLEMSTELSVPSRLTQSVLRTLTATRLVTEVAGAEAAFMPARPLQVITAHDILLAMRTGTGQELPLPEDASLAAIYGEFARIEQAERAAAAGVSLDILANRMASPGQLAAPQATAPAIEAKTPPAAPTPVVETVHPPKPEEVPPPPAFPDKVEVAPPSEPEAEPSAPQAVPEPEPASPERTTEPVAPAEAPRREAAQPRETDFPL